MPTVQKHALVPYTAEQMYRLVNDVRAYPSFLPWCREAQVEYESETEMRASLFIQKGPFKERFTTHNHLEKNRAIHLHLISGPFKTFQGDWLFSPEKYGTRVSLSLFFEMERGLVSQLFSPVFEGLSNRFVEAFCERADALHRDGCL